MKQINNKKSVFKQWKTKAEIRLNEVFIKLVGRTEKQKQSI